MTQLEMHVILYHTYGAMPIMCTTVPIFHTHAMPSTTYYAPPMQCSAILYARIIMPHPCNVVLKLYARIKGLQIKKPHAKAGLRNQEGKILMTTQDMLDRWKEYVRELYSENRSKLTIINEDRQKITQISEEEVQQVLKTIPRNKATGVDDIPAESLQCCGPQIVKIVTKTINRIYETGEFPGDFLTCVFFLAPETSNAAQCEQY